MNREKKIEETLQNPFNITKIAQGDPKINSCIESWSRNPFNHQENYPDICQITSKISFSKNDELSHKQQILAQRKRFIDHTFTSMIKNTTQNIFQKVHDWRRPEEIYGLGNYLLFNEVTGRLKKVQQSKSSNFHQCLSFVSLNPNLIERLFKYKGTNVQGVYSIWLQIEGTWNEIIVDDRLPLIKRMNGGKGKLSQFSRYENQNGRNEIWYSLIEKAFFKGYRGKRCFDFDFKTILKNLTGSPCQEMSLRMTEENQNERVHQEQVFEKITEALNRGYLVAFKKNNSENELIIDPIFQALKRQKEKKRKNQELYLKIGWGMNYFECEDDEEDSLFNEIESLSSSKYGNLKKLEDLIWSYDTLIILKTSRLDKFTSDEFLLEKQKIEKCLKGGVKINVSKRGNYGFEVSQKNTSKISTEFTFGLIEKSKRNISFVDRHVTSGDTGKTSLFLEEGEYLILIKITEKEKSDFLSSGRATLSINGPEGCDFSSLGQNIIQNYELFLKEIWTDFCLKNIYEEETSKNKRRFKYFFASKKQDGIFHHEEKVYRFSYQVIKIQERIWIFQLKNNENKQITFECCVSSEDDSFKYIGDDGLVKDTAHLTLPPKKEGSFMIKSNSDEYIEKILQNIRIVPKDTLINNINSISLKQERIDKIFKEMRYKQPQFSGDFQIEKYEEEEIPISCDLKDYSEIENIPKEKLSEENFKAEINQLLVLNRSQIKYETILKAKNQLVSEEHEKIMNEFKKLRATIYEPQNIEKICTGIKELLPSYKIENESLLQNQINFKEKIFPLKTEYEKRMKGKTICWKKIKNRAEPEFFVNPHRSIREIGSKKEISEKIIKVVFNQKKILEENMEKIDEFHHGLLITQGSYQTLKLLFDNEKKNLVFQEEKIILKNLRTQTKRLTQIIKILLKSLNIMKTEHQKMIDKSETILTSMKENKRMFSKLLKQLSDMKNSKYFKLRGNMRKQVEKIENFKKSLNEAESEYFGLSSKKITQKILKQPNASIMIKNMLNDLNMQSGTPNLSRKRNPEAKKVYAEIVNCAKTFSNKFSFLDYEKDEIILTNSGIQKVKYFLVSQKIKAVRAFLLAQNTDKIEGLNINQKLLIINEGCFLDKNLFPSYEKLSLLSIGKIENCINFQERLFIRIGTFIIQASKLLGNKQIFHHFNPKRTYLEKIIRKLKKKKIIKKINQSLRKKKFYNRDQILMKLQKLNDQTKLVQNQIKLESEISFKDLSISPQKSETESNSTEKSESDSNSNTSDSNKTSSSLEIKRVSVFIESPEERNLRLKMNESTLRNDDEMRATVPVNRTLNSPFALNEEIYKKTIKKINHSTNHMVRSISENTFDPDNKLKFNPNLEQDIKGRPLLPKKNNLPKYSTEKEKRSSSQNRPMQSSTYQPRFACERPKMEEEKKKAKPNLSNSFHKRVQMEPHLDQIFSTYDGKFTKPKFNFGGEIDKFSHTQDLNNFHSRVEESKPKFEKKYPVSEKVEVFRQSLYSMRNTFYENQNPSKLKQSYGPVRTYNNQTSAPQIINEPFNADPPPQIINEPFKPAAPPQNNFIPTRKLENKNIPPKKIFNRAYSAPNRKERVAGRKKQRPMHFFDEASFQKELEHSRERTTNIPERFKKYKKKSKSNRNRLNPNRNRNRFKKAESSHNFEPVKKKGRSKKDQLKKKLQLRNKNGDKNYQSFLQNETKPKVMNRKSNKLAYSDRLSYQPQPKRRKKKDPAKQKPKLGGNISGRKKLFGKRENKGFGFW